MTALELSERAEGQLASLTPDARCDLLAHAESMPVGQATTVAECWAGGHWHRLFVSPQPSGARRLISAARIDSAARSP